MTAHKFVLNSTFYAKPLPAANDDNIDPFNYVQTDIDFAHDSIISGAWDIYTGAIYLLSKIEWMIEPSQYDDYFKKCKSRLFFFAWDQTVIDQSELILMCYWSLFLELGDQVTTGFLTVKQAVALFIHETKNEIAHYLHPQSFVYFELCMIGNIEGLISV
jgi:hypothetical protein